MTSELYVIGRPNIIDFDKPDTRATRLREFCNAGDLFPLTRNSFDHDHTPLFPGDSQLSLTNHAWGEIISHSGFDYEHGVEVFILGCVSYHFQASTTYHSTRFIYEVSTDDAVGGMIQPGVKRESADYKLVLLPEFTIVN